MALSPDYWTHLAGEKHFDEEMTRRIAGGEKLTDLQVEFHRRGREEAELCKGIAGWHIRRVSGLFEIRTIESNIRDYNDAVYIGQEWVAEDPQNRSLIVRNGVIPEGC